MTQVTIDLTSGRERLMLKTDPSYKYVLNSIMTRRKLPESHAFAFLLGSTLLKSKITSKIDRSQLILAIQDEINREGFKAPPTVKQLESLLRKARREVSADVVS